MAFAPTVDHAPVVTGLYKSVPTVYAPYPTIPISAVLPTIGAAVFKAPIPQPMP